MKSLIESFDAFNENRNFSVHKNYFMTNMKMGQTEIDLIKAEIPDAEFKWDHMSNKQHVISDIPHDQLQSICLRLLDQHMENWMKADSENPHTHKYRKTPFLRPY